MLWSWRWSRDSLYGRQTDLKLQATYLYVRLVLQSLTFSFWTVFDDTWWCVLWLYQKTPWLYQKNPFVFISRVDLIALTTPLAGLCCAVLTSEHLSCTSQRIGWLNGFQYTSTDLYTPTDITATLWMVATHTHTHTRYCNVSPQFRTFRLTHSLFSKQAILTNYIAHPTGLSLPLFCSRKHEIVWDGAGWTSWHSLGGRRRRDHHIEPVPHNNIVSKCGTSLFDENGADTFDSSFVSDGNSALPRTPPSTLCTPSLPRRNTARSFEHALMLDAGGCILVLL